MMNSVVLSELDQRPMQRVPLCTAVLTVPLGAVVQVA